MSAINYKDNFVENFEAILASSTGERSIYQKALAHIKSEFDNFQITDDARAKFITSLMAEMTIAFTTKAMDAAGDVATKALTLEKELEALELKNQGLRDRLELDKQNLQMQIELTKAQTEKTKAETKLAEEQQVAIKEQINDNRIIKAGMMTGDFMQNVSNGNLSVPSDMFEYLFNIIDEIIKRAGINIKKVKNFNLPKIK
ncbi:hypothetical protein [Campylobacter concisus]|jgi:hypothetical protein|uniref:Uncharacterized protein n=1 Tax=Campylobacter concisus TaxID=199 RepID=A0A1L9QYD0_9BACT|nr:hypothetical protein [Campylobacter concisus]DAM82275.1 MAG TPA: hypothetical protein [Caudoviricetes sp.]OJJ27681.1 hypothetical protein TH67_09860 [Campylobacter concisus]ORI07427.1 hypothetical protein A3835_07690 [Campylobacter concisus]DAR91262.1 MAG TPA: hypothetical protein [Caudoviricetes sp.]DAX90057.1 MAG TPA: hypothetical protein [Caudoviricetes sp.]